MKPVLTLWLLFAAFIVYGATIPFHFAPDWTRVVDTLRNLPLNPLVSPDTGRRLSIPDVVQNVMLFLPFGAMGFLAGAKDWTRLRQGFGGQARWTGVTRIAFVTVLGGSLSVVVEGLQLLTSDRIASVGDVVANTTGAFLGAFVAWQLREVFTAGVRRLRTEGLDVGELRPLAIVALVLGIAFWQPFDVTLDVSTIVGKVRSLEGDVWQFDGLRDEEYSVMLSAMFAMTLASYWSVLGEPHAGRRTAAVGFLVVFVLEGAQVFIGSRMPGLWDALVAAAGVTIGVVIWVAASRIIWPALWLGVIVLATFTAAAVQMLRPFEIAAEYRSMGWFPFLGYYSHTTFEALSHVIELMLLYFPLGFWLGPSQPTRRRALALGFLLTLAIAGPIEYLQGWIVGRYPDTTDVAISLAGVWIGVRAYNGQRA